MLFRSGVVAPELGWNDYAGLDMKGKTAVILINDPGFATDDPTLFKGRALTYYGRWTYKFEEAARQFLMAKVPTIFPGPLVLWAWNEKAAKKAAAIRHLYNTIKECVTPQQHAMLIPMPDYRPKYPKINPEVEINPNHPNLTI